LLNINSKLFGGLGVNVSHSGFSGAEGLSTFPGTGCMMRSPAGIGAGGVFA
jgi:hypothetical protein